MRSQLCSGFFAYERTALVTDPLFSLLLLVCTYGFHVALDHDYHVGLLTAYESLILPHLTKYPSHIRLILSISLPIA